MLYMPLYGYTLSSFLVFHPFLHLQRKRLFDYMQEMYVAMASSVVPLVLFLIWKTFFGEEATCGCVRSRRP